MLPHVLNLWHSNPLPSTTAGPGSCSLPPSLSLVVCVPVYTSTLWSFLFADPLSIRASHVPPEPEHLQQLKNASAACRLSGGREGGGGGGGGGCSPINTVLKLSKNKTREQEGRFEQKSQLKNVELLHRRCFFRVLNTLIVHKQDDFLNKKTHIFYTRKA